MFKKSLAWVLTLALMLSTLSGLALITSADGEAFAYASFFAGEALTKNATKTLDLITEHGGVLTDIHEMTGNADDRGAFFMTLQNDQLGITPAATAGLGANAVIEVKFFPDPDNKADTRLGINFGTGSHNKDGGNTTDYGWVKMSGAAGAETVVIDAALQDVVTATVDFEEVTVTAEDGTESTVETGWEILTVTVSDANFNGLPINMVNWSSTNGDDTGEGWYIHSMLVYNVDEKPGENQYGIREDVIGYHDFTDGSNSVVTVSGGKEATVDDETVLELAKGEVLKVDAVQPEGKLWPAVMAEDVDVTLMAEIKDGAEGEWKVVRADVENDGAISFDYTAALLGDCTADAIYVRKVVLAQTKLIVANTSDSAYVNFDEPYCEYDLFQRVTTPLYKATYDYEGDAANLTVDDYAGKTAAKAAGGYLRFNVDDAFTKNGAANVADLAITITYFDKGEGTLAIEYNKAIPADTEDATEYQFAKVEVAKLTNPEEGSWKTATVYLSDAQFRNAANGNDFRIVMGDLGSESAIAAVEVTIGADKAELEKWSKKLVNAFAYEADAVNAFKNAQTSAKTLVGTETATAKYATKAQVDAQVAAMKAAYEDLPNHPSTDVDKRFTLTNAVWVGASKDASGDVITDGDNGSIVKVDGWFTWAFPTATSGKYIGIAPADEDLFADSTSVTYEYDVKFDTTCGNDRVFMGYGSNTYGWTSVNDKTNQPNFNGFQAAGSWLQPSPAMGKWGKIAMTNADYDNTQTSTVETLTGAITTLGAWIDNDDKAANFYVRSIKVFDTNDPKKFIMLEFHEDVTELVVTPAEGVTEAEVDGYTGYQLKGNDSLTISTAEPIADGVVTKGENKVTVAVEFNLADCTNADEKLVLTYGDGKTAEKTTEDLTIRNNWIRTSFELEDADFGSVEDLKLEYLNGETITIRGIKVFACTENEEGDRVMSSEKPASWGISLLDQDAMDYAFVDWATGKSYGLTYAFKEGSGMTEQWEGDRNAAIFSDDKLFITVDDSVVDETVKFVRIDITHEQGCTLYVEYNATLPEGVDDSAEPNLSYYRFRASGENKAISKTKDETTGEETEGYNWITTEDDFVNMLGVIKPTGEMEDPDNPDWLTTSIYLTDAQFRNMANGDDFRIVSIGYSFISRVEVRASTEEEYNAAKAQLGDQTALKAAVAEAEEKYGDNAPEALEAAQLFVEYGYRATQAEVDAALAALTEALSGAWGDVDGNGKVNTTDARLTLQRAAGRIDDTKLDVTKADVDGNGKINTTDARLILQRAADRIPSFPVEK